MKDLKFEIFLKEKKTNFKETFMLKKNTLCFLVITSFL